MPPKKAASANDNESPIGLTDGELRFIKAVFDNMVQRPDADWVKVAADLGLKDAKCAKERFRQMSVRHGWRDQPSAASSPRKRNAVTGPSDEGPATPAKRTRTPRKKSFKQIEGGEAHELMVEELADFY